MIASSNLSPATFKDASTTGSQSEITEISVVPPPMSTTIEPQAFVISIPAPIAAAIGSLMRNTSLAPA